jgi:hypothetical protein
MNELLFTRNLKEKEMKGNACVSAADAYGGIGPPNLLVLPRGSGRDIFGLTTPRRYDAGPE